MNQNDSVPEARVDEHVALAARQGSRDRIPGVLSVGAGLLMVLTVAHAGPGPAPAVGAQQAPVVFEFAGVGPQRSIVCPVTAVTLAVGADLPRMVAARPAGTTFCLRSGVHRLTRAITPKSGDTFIGEFGAILDGSGWTTTDSTQAAIRAHNEDIDDVTIRNLVVRNMPQKGIHAFRDFSDRWTIEHNEIAFNTVGLNGPNGAVVRRNLVHHNVGVPNSPTPAERGGALGFYQSANVLFEGNAVYANGPEMKWSLTRDVVVRANYFRQNHRDGIWFDGDNVGFVIEDNLVEDHPGAGIFDEISGRGIIRNNTVRRSGETGVFISTSKDVEIQGNRLEGNRQGILYFVNCGAVGGGTLEWDLTNAVARDNVIDITGPLGAYASGLSYTDCTPEQFQPYVNGSKVLEFAQNRYLVPSTATRYWFWGAGVFKSFTEWQDLGRDRLGTLSR